MANWNDYHRTAIGEGVVQPHGDHLHLTLPPVTRATYHDAQISSYSRSREFHLRPPLRMTVRAHATGTLHGTAGFGVWNHPFMPGERRLRLPRAAWFFFASPPNDMALALDVPGSGWKAATFDATRWQFLALLPAAPLGFLLMRVPALYRRLWPVGQRAIGVSEYALDPALLRESHEYRMEWHTDRVTFALDDEIIHRSPFSPAGPLGFVAWVDNQYAVVTPQGRIGMGLLDTEHSQTLVLEALQVEPLPSP